MCLCILKINRVNLIYYTNINYIVYMLLKMVFHNIIDFNDVSCNGRSQHATFVEARVWYAKDTYDILEFKK